MNFPSVSFPLIDPPPAYYPPPPALLLQSHPIAIVELQALHFGLVGKGKGCAASRSKSSSKSQPSGKSHKFEPSKRAEKHKAEDEADSALSFQKKLVIESSHFDLIVFILQDSQCSSKAHSDENQGPHKAIQTSSCHPHFTNYPLHIDPMAEEASLYMPLLPVSHEASLMELSRLSLTFSI